MADVDLLVQSFDDLFRRALRSANAETRHLPRSLARLRSKPGTSKIF